MVCGDDEIVGLVFRIFVMFLCCCSWSCMERRWYYTPM